MHRYKILDGSTTCPTGGVKNVDGSESLPIVALLWFEDSVGVSCVAAHLCCHGPELVLVFSICWGSSLRYIRDPERRSELGAECKESGAACADPLMTDLSLRLQINFMGYLQSQG